ncbi:MAG: nucleotidyltransferase [Clostridiales bacterium]|nr:nucleotidyltransferase [Clostridiales bacterium]
MRTVGIVCEYNPFHNGHLNHMRRAAAQPDGEFVVCVMSSDFLQRGEPAILPKNLRAESAIMNGADLVFELPSVFSCSSAEFYASSSVQMMGRLGIVDSIVFGSEDNDIEFLKKIASILVDEPENFKLQLKKHLASGVSFAKARSLAISEYLGNDDTQRVIEGSNNILGIEYIKAILREGLPINPVSVPRIAEEYKNDFIAGKYPSATAIRHSIMNIGLVSVKEFLPLPTYNLLKNFYADNNNFINMELLKDAIFYRIAALSTTELSKFHGVSEGFENRLKSSLSSSSTVSELIEVCSTKRYPKTRVARILIHILLGLKKEEAESIWSKGPLYARLLAASKKGMSLIPVLERNSSIPVFTSLKPFYGNAQPSWKTILDYEIKASDIYSTAAGLPTGRDFTTKFNVL